jgi:hypothetical protein
MTDLSPPSTASAAACSVRTDAVPSQIALLLTALTQPIAKHSGIIANRFRIIHRLPCSGICLCDVKSRLLTRVALSGGEDRKDSHSACYKPRYGAPGAIW